MKNHLLVLVIFLLSTAVWLGCGDDSSGEDEGGEDATGGFGSGADGDPTVGSGDDVGGFGSGSGDDGSGSGDFEACETLSSNLDKVGTRVMLLQDISSSMQDVLGNGQTKWQLAKTAIEGMVNAYESEIEFGLDLFPGPNGNCSVRSSVALDVALDNASTINTNLGATDTSRTTPLLRAMLNFTNSAYAPTFLDGNGGSYLLVVSDGADTCGAADGQGQQNASAAELEAVTANLRNLFGIRTIVIGFGQNVDAAQLSAIAAAGGTTFNTYLQADDGVQLSDALSQIAEKVVSSCEFHVGTFENPDVDLDLVYVSIDGEGIGPDPDCAKGKGWTWTSEARSTIEFCYEKCQEIEDGKVDNITVELACSADQVPVVE